MPIQGVAVIASGMKPVITPTYRGPVISAIINSYQESNFSEIP